MFVCLFSQFYSGNSDHEVTSFTERLFATAFPQWTYEHDGKTMLRLPVRRIIANRLAGYNEVRPWILNAGFAESILLDSPASEVWRLAHN